MTSEALRQCQPCTACCDGWVRINVFDQPVLPAWTTWRTFAVDLALPVGARIPHKSLKWLQDYSKASFRPLIFTEQEVDSTGHFTGKQKVQGFGPPTFQQEMKQLITGRRLG